MLGPGRFFENFQTSNSGEFACSKSKISQATIRIGARTNGAWRCSPAMLEHESEAGGLVGR
jgi:hypothetical protein